nr:ankyrin repeat family protein [Tanacetum cinerariifolium]
MQLIQKLRHDQKHHVTLFVAYDGKWEYDDKEWFFKNSEGSMLVVPKHITLSEITDILYAKFDVDKFLYHLMLEVHWIGSPWYPSIKIQNDKDLSVFISETSKTKLPLCVTRLENNKTDVVNRLKKDKTHVVTQLKDESDDDEKRQKDDTVENRIMKAIRKGDWVKAREIVNTEEVTWTSKLDDYRNTAFHFAVGEYKNIEVVRDILMWINSELLVTTVNINGMNPVHTAARFGNTEALKIMLDYNPKCLFVPIKYWDDLAINCALKIPSIETFQYLFKKMQSDKDEFDAFLSGKSAFKLLGQVIDTGLIDVPIESNSVVSTNTADEENQETPKKDKFVTKYTKDVISRMCVKFWETTLLHVPHVKHLKEDKVKHNTTIKLLRLICKEVDRTYTSSEIIERLCSSPFCLAVENNTDEAIEVLTTYLPQSCWFRKDGQNVFQLTVLNRSEKVYSYILHHGRNAKFGFSISDADGNNILHLAGRLSPIHKLASRPALQMQKELQWFE